MKEGDITADGYMIEPYAWQAEGIMHGNRINFDIRVVSGVYCWHAIIETAYDLVLATSGVSRSYEKAANNCVAAMLEAIEYDPQFDIGAFEEIEAMFEKQKYPH